MINGIGPRRSAELEALGIGTIAELATAAEKRVETFANVMHAGYWMPRGRDERPVVTLRDPKFLSREITFERDLHISGNRV